MSGEELLRAAHQAASNHNHRGACEAFSAASLLFPLDAEIWLQIGISRANLGELDKAREALDHCLQLAPGHNAAYVALAGIEAVLANAIQAKEISDQVLTNLPHLPSAHWNRAHQNLLLGNYKEGWADYEYGWVTKHRRLRLPPHSLWHGDYVKRLFIWCEQGYGDIIQFARFIPNLPAAHKTFEVRKELFRLFQVQKHLADKITIQPLDFSTSVEFDQHISELSLPFVLGIEKEDVPCDAYLEFPRLGKEFNLPAGRKIGIVWAGNPSHANDKNRSLSFEDVRPLIESGLDVKWICPMISRIEPHENLLNVGGELADWADTAALLEHLDLLITCDTGIAHLAGALGKPVFLLIPFAPDWRWGQDEIQSHWYPSVKIFSQRKPGDWGSVIKNVLKELR